MREEGTNDPPIYSRARRVERMPLLRSHSEQLIASTLQPHERTAAAAVVGVGGYGGNTVGSRAQRGGRVVPSIHAPDASAPRVAEALDAFGAPEGGKRRHRSVGDARWKHGRARRPQGRRRGRWATAHGTLRRRPAPFRRWAGRVGHARLAAGTGIGNMLRWCAGGRYTQRDIRIRRAAVGRRTHVSRQTAAGG